MDKKETLAEEIVEKDKMATSFSISKDMKPNKREEEFLIQDERFNGGWAMKLTIIHYPRWTEVNLEDDRCKRITGVDLELLKHIIALAETRQGK